ncbi:hypothetical protein PCE1_004843 [Barthelona sp. PCE]
MPRIQPHIDCRIGVVNSNSSRSIFKPKGFNPKSEATFMVIHNHKDRIDLPENCSFLRQCGSQCIIYMDDDHKRDVKTRTTLYKLVGKKFEVLRTVSLNELDTDVKSYVVLSNTFIIAHLRDSSIIINLCAGTVQCFDYLVDEYLKAPVFFMGDEHGCMIPTIIDEELKLIEFQIPYVRGCRIVEIINSILPSYFFLGTSKLFHVRIVEGVARVTEYPSIHFHLTHYPKQCFLYNNVYYFHMSSLGVFVGYNLSGDVPLRSVDASGTRYMSLMHVDGVVYGLVDRFMYPLAIESNVGGYGIVPNAHHSMVWNEFFKFPMIASPHHVITFDLFGETPSATVYGAVEGDSRLLYGLNSNFKRGKIVTNQIYLEKEECSENMLVYDEDNQLIHKERNRDGSNFCKFLFVSNAMIYLEGGTSDEVFIKEGKFCLDGNLWFDVRASDNVIWFSGSSNFGVALLDESGSVIQFDTYNVDVDSYDDVIPNLYDPLMALVCGDAVSWVRYDPDTRSFIRKIICDVEVGYRNCFFLDDDVVLLKGKMYRITNDGAERMEVEIPWSCNFSNLKFAYHGFKNTIYRTHLRLDGYDMVFDSLKFNNDFSSYVLEEKRYNIFELLSTNAEFIPISEVCGRFLNQISMHYTYAPYYLE